MIDNKSISFELADAYASQFSSPTDAILQALYDETYQSVRGAHMISGALQGKLLELLSGMIKPRNILELGTYTGYATICLAKGLTDNGKVHTIDIDESLNELRFKYWNLAALDNKIQLHIGKASEVINTITDPIDFAFIDADKGNYIHYLDLLTQKMPVGSYILADNTLFHGEVFKPVSEQNKTGNIIHRFNEYVQQHSQLEHVLLPIRDGITLIKIKQ